MRNGFKVLEIQSTLRFSTVYASGLSVIL